VFDQTLSSCQPPIKSTLFRTKRTIRADTYRTLTIEIGGFGFLDSIEAVLIFY